MDQRCPFALFVEEQHARLELTAVEVACYSVDGQPVAVRWRGAEQPRGTIYGAPRGEWRSGKPFYSVCPANKDDYHDLSEDPLSWVYSWRCWWPW